MVVTRTASKVAFFLLLLLGSISAQQLSPEERLLNARGQALESFFQESVAQLEELSLEFPLSDIDAFSRLEKAVTLLAESPANANEADDIYAGIISDFPGSGFEIYAKQQRLDLKLHRGQISVDEFIAQLNSLIILSGGPSLYQLSDLSFKEVPFFTQEQQSLFLAESYILATSRILESPDIEITSELLQLSESVARFHRAKFRDSDISRGLLDRIEFIKSGDLTFVNRAPELEAPVVLEPHQSRLTPSQSLFFDIHDGDRNGSQIALPSIRLTLDNEALGPGKYAIVAASSSEAIYEPFTVEVLPQGSWSLGVHTLTTQVADFEGNLVEKTISFTVIQERQFAELTTTKDSTIRAQKPHRNEGANPRLFLSHRLEARNKSLNPIVAFDFANTDLNGLTKATLVMNVQDCDLPRRWGNQGRLIEAHPMTQPWTEGNGNKYRQKGQEGRTKGNGPGVTWFSPTDDEIRNNRPNGSSQWSGARMSLGPLTAPAVQVTNGQTGPVEFDVTQDVLNGYYEGWLLKKQDEAKFGNIRFFSKEAGDSEIAPKLLLEFNGQVARGDGSRGLLAGFNGLTTKLRPTAKGSELKNLRNVLQESSTAAVLGEGVVAFAAPNPAVGSVARLAYRAWLG